MPPLCFLGVFYFAPLAAICLRSLGGGAALPAAAHMGGVLWFTTWQALLSTLLTLGLAMPAAWLFARYTFPGKELLRTLATIPFVLPTVVVAAAFQALLGRQGLLNNMLVQVFALSGPPVRLEGTVWIIVLAHVFYNFSVVLRLVGGFWAGLDPSLGEAARTLGASPVRVFRTVTWPLLRPAVGAASLLVFMFCFSSFGVILILGGPHFATVEVEIYRQAMHLFNLKAAAVLSLVQIVFTFCLMWVYTRLQRTVSVPQDVRVSPRTRHLGKPGERALAGTVLTVMTVLLVAPLLALVLRSVMTADGLSLAYYQALFKNVSGSLFYIPPLAAMRTSLLTALITLGLSLVLGLLAATWLAADRSRLGGFLDPLFMLPLSTSAVTLGFGFILAFGAPPLNLRTSFILVPLAHTLVAFPFVVRALLPALRRIPPNLREAAALLGANPLAVWRHVDLPVAARGLLAGAVFAFTVSMGEFGATAFVARPQTPTMPLAIYRFLSQPGTINYGQAMAMSTLLMLLTGLCFRLLDISRADRHGEF